jgi:hypothetical protein
MEMYVNYSVACKHTIQNLAEWWRARHFVVDSMLRCDPFYLCSLLPYTELLDREQCFHAS